MVTTQNFGLAKIIDGSGRLSDGGYKFSSADRDTIDTLLLIGTTTHKHTGGTELAVATPASPTLTTASGSGNIPGGTTLYYRISVLAPDGLESKASDPVFVTTAAPLGMPGVPTIQPFKTGGTLEPGTYAYAVSAWQNYSTEETEASGAVGYVLPSDGGGAQRIEVTLPDYPDLTPPAHYGFNIYKRGPSGSVYEFLVSIDLSGVPSDDPNYLGSTTITGFNDDGTVGVECDRLAPRRNGTVSRNTVQIAYPGTVPVGSTWKVFRSFSVDSWANSLIHTVVEETSEGSGVISPTYTDTGSATLGGTPYETALIVQSPDPINLETETTGVLQASRAVHQVTVDYTAMGPLTPSTGSFRWMCPFDSATVEDATIAFPTGKGPDGNAIFAQVNLHKAGSSHALFSTNPLTVAAGADGSARIDTDAGVDNVLGLDDWLTVDVLTADSSGIAEDIYIQIRVLGRSDFTVIPSSLL